MLSASGYPYPPLYEGHDFTEGGVHRCSVTLTIPQHPLNVEWASIVIQVGGHRLLDAWEMAAMWCIAAFCDAHPMVVVLMPFGLFTAPDEGDLLWQNRMDHVHVMADLDPVGFLRTAPQCTNAPYRLQVFQSQATAQLVDQAQTLQTTLQLRDEQMHEAGAELADMGARIGTLEGQVQSCKSLLPSA